MSNSIEQIMHGINTDNTDITRNALGKWVGMQIRDELDEFETDKIRELSDKWMKEKAELDEQQKNGSAKKEEMTAKRIKLFIELKIKPTLEEVNRRLEEVNRRMEWTRPFCTQE